MRKLLFLCLSVALLTACGNKAQNEALKAQNDSLTYVLAERDAELDDIMSAFNEVQEGFRQINEAENRVDTSCGYRWMRGNVRKCRTDGICKYIPYLGGESAIGNSYAPRRRLSQCGEDRGKNYKPRII